MKNITVSVDDETYRRARVKAAERDTSVSAMVREFLTELGAGKDFTQLVRDEEALRARIQSFKAADRLSREKLHDRSR